MAEIQPAPELVDPATEPVEGSDPAPVEGQPAETPAEATPPQTYHVGDEDYDVATLTDYITTAKNAKEMHRSAHEKNTAANEALQKVIDAQNDPKRKRLDYIIQTLEENPQLAQQWDRLERASFAPDGTPTNALAMGAQMRELNERVEALSAEKGAMQADDYLDKFAAAKGITKKQAEEVGAKFLADTKREDFPPEANVLSQLDYFYYSNYERDGAEAKLSAAKAEGFTEAIAKVKAGQAAELGSPATRSEVPWTPPPEAKNLPHMQASELAALADTSIVFDDDITID